MIIRLSPLMGLLLCLTAMPVQAKTHLDHDELKILSASSVAVVYVDTDTALEHQLDPEHHMLGVTPLTAVLADVLNSYRLHMLLAHLTPYQSSLDKLALPQSTHKGVQDALVSVPWLQKTPWTDARPDPKDPLFLTRQAEQAKAPVVIFIRPQLFMGPDADALYMVCAIDIETAVPGGSEVSHYDSSDVVISEPVDDAGLPVPDQTHDLGDLRMAKLFANDGEGFKQLYAKLVADTQQQLYYYFTGYKSSQSVPAVSVGQ